MEFSPIDTIWILIAAFLVFFMNAGFAFVESGFTRAKNTVNILMKNFIVFSISCIAYFLVGFGLMFGKDTGGFIGANTFMAFFNNPENISKFTYFFFELVFAGTAATIVSGAMAERTKFASFLVYSTFMTAVVYPIIGHWIWGGGWLSKIGFIDFAGSTVVHSVGGWTALTAVMMLGPRLGKYNPDGKSNAIPGHNIGFATLGVFILWFGWFGFNGGSTLSGTSKAIPLIVVNTTLAAAAGSISAMFYIWARFKKPDASMALNGALAGLVGITAGCALVSPYSAIIIGLIAGVLVCVAIDFFDKKLKIDDPVGAVSVHGACGTFGTLAVGLFAQTKYSSLAGFNNISGLFFGGGWKLFLVQLTGAVSVFTFVSGIFLLFFLLLKKTMGLRVKNEEEIKGLDIEEHGMEAYAGFQIFTNE